MHGAVKTTLIIFAAINAWIALGYFIFVRDVGSLPAGDVRVIATCALLLIAPGLTFIPIARALAAPLYEIEGIVGWATFGFVVTFVAPGETLSRAEFLVFLLPLTVVVATVATLIAYAFGYRIYRSTPWQRDFLRARRQGYLVGLVSVGMFLLNAIEVLTLVTGLLLVLIAVLCEVLMLSRVRPARVSRSHAPARSLPGTPDQAGRTP